MNTPARPVRRNTPWIQSLSGRRMTLAVFVSVLAVGLRAQTTPAAPAEPPAELPTPPPLPMLRIAADKVAAKSSPILYGFMTEEINFSYDGGLYAELVRNRTFRDNAQNPVHWSLVKDATATAAIVLDSTQPLNAALPVSLRLDLTAGGGPKQRAGIANEGYWGMAVRPETTYRASFYAKAAPGFAGPLTVSLETTDGKTVFARANVTGVSGEWKKYEVQLTTGKSFAPSATNRLVILASSPGTVWFNLVSLFPPTFNNRPNGMRPDIMQLLVDYKPGFLRFPGGNYLEGKTPATRFKWKETVGDVAQRPGHLNDAWGYWSSDGVGLLEFLEWCEDMKAEPVLGVFAGLYLAGGTPIVPAGPGLEPFVQEALEEIEYVTGDATTTKWGAQRAKDGHPAPFKLTYIEVGNEDNLSGGGPSYPGRFSQFAEAIRAKYPQLKLIASTAIPNATAKPDVVDEHAYPRTPLSFQTDHARYDNLQRYPRTGPKIFVGEYATRTPTGSPTPNLNAALGDAAYLTGFERNSDHVIMASYAPLFANVSDARLRQPGSSMQWDINLIGYDALTSYGSPSYYAQLMFSAYRGDVVLPVTGENIPVQAAAAVPARAAVGPVQINRTPLPPPRAAAPARPVPSLFYVATRDTKTGTIFLKIVNVAGTSQVLQVEISGATVQPRGEAVLMSATAVSDTNTITQPNKVAPLTASVGNLGPSFTRSFPAYSITVLQIPAK